MTPGGDQIVAENPLGSVGEVITQPEFTLGSDVAADGGGAIKNQDQLTGNLG